MPRTFEGLIGATAFLVGSIAVYGLADLIDGGNMHDIAAYEVSPQTPVSGAMRVDTCRNCGKPVYMPADREMHVLGTLCSRECEIANAEHFGQDDYE